MKTESDIKEQVEILQKGNHKLYLLSILTGIVTGLIVSLYRYALEFLNTIRGRYISSELLTQPLYLSLLWALFIIIGIFVYYLSKKFPLTGGSGIPQVKALLIKRLEYKSWWKDLIVKFTGGLLGIGAGLSLGREGPSVQMGSYIGDGITKIFKGNDTENKYLITAGSSAGLSGAFGAPLSGVIFSMEELHRFFSTKLIICTFLASIFSNFITRRIFGTATSFELTSIYPTNVNSYLLFLSFIIFGIILAIFGKLFTVSLLKCQDIFKNLHFNPYIKVAFIMSLSFFICIFLPDISGGGHQLVETLPNMKGTIIFLLLLFFLKLFFTTISYSTGFQGGIFLPMLVLGAILGKIYALSVMDILNLSQNYTIHYMILGMAGYFVAVVRAPITGVILILEMTGSFDHLLALATVSIVAFYITELFKLEPIYEILYERMPKKSLAEIDITEEKEEHLEKTIICFPVTGDSEFENKMIKDINWPKNTLVVGIRRMETEYIPKGTTKILAGDILILLLPKKKAELLNETFFNKGVAH